MTGSWGFGKQGAILHPISVIEKIAEKLLSLKNDTL